MKKEKLYILPFDHRGSFIKMFGFDEKNLTAEQTTTLSDYKHLIYEGFLRALDLGVNKDFAAILVDEQFGAKIQEEARELGVTRILTVEKSGQDEFDFEYGEQFGQHIDKFKPDYVKALVRYNADGDPEINQRQIARLKILNDFCHERGYGFLFELLAVATKEQLVQCGGDSDMYEKTCRGEVMAESIRELQNSGVEPDVWKLEGLTDFEQMRAVVEQSRVGGRSSVGVVVLGRGESEEKVRQWLQVAASITGVIGFAVGRTVFKRALMEHEQGQTSREEAADIIAKNYKSFVDLFEASR